MNEDQIIAEGLTLVRRGILDGDWQKVCDGYNHISGESLSSPKAEKSRLENIRELMQNIDPTPDHAKEVSEKHSDLDHIDWHGLTVKQILDTLQKKYQITVARKEFKLKDDLIEIAENIEKDQNDIIENSEYIETVNEDGIHILSVPFDAKEAAKNKKKHIKRPKVKKRDTELGNLEQRHKSEKGAFRYTDTPLDGPPW